MERVTWWAEEAAKIQAKFSFTNSFTKVMLHTGKTFVKILHE